MRCLWEIKIDTTPENSSLDAVREDSHITLTIFFLLLQLSQSKIHRKRDEDCSSSLTLSLVQQDKRSNRTEIPLFLKNPPLFNFCGLQMSYLTKYFEKSLLNDEIAESQSAKSKIHVFF
jgi:hypothetical protein